MPTSKTTARLVVVGISLAAGIGAAVLAGGSKTPEIHEIVIAKGPVSTIVVAAGPLEYGTTLTDDNLSEVPWESLIVPEGAFNSKADLLKDGARAALTSMNRNEPVLSSRITGPNQPASLAALTEPGMRAVSVRVDEARGVAGFVRMGDRVDVILTRTDSGNELRSSYADVLLQGVKVLATGQIANDRQEHPTVVQTVTLEVSTEQAQKLILAEKVGTLSLVLRQVGKAVPEAVRRITLADLGGPEPAAAPAPSRVAEVWIYRGATEPKIYLDVYREPYRQAR
ncbi:MAG: Flp pilus assembly protein CpaB [Pseudomonadota bacterium]|nr:Flp pilus assembly protein CpaB [Pseudomonadota bacterium]